MLAVDASRLGLDLLLIGLDGNHCCPEVYSGQQKGDELCLWIYRKKNFHVIKL